MQQREVRRNQATGAEEVDILLAIYWTVSGEIPGRLDAVVQTLFSAGLIADVLPRIWARDPQEGHARLAELCLLTRAAISEVHSLLIDLRSRKSDACISPGIDADRDEDF